MTEKKYSWVDRKLDSWLKEQARCMREGGMRADTTDASKILVDHILVPNRVNLAQIYKPKPPKIKMPTIPYNKGWKKKKIF